MNTDHNNNNSGDNNNNNNNNSNTIEHKNKNMNDKKIKYKSEKASPNRYKVIYKKSNEKTFNINKIPQKNNKNLHDKKNDINSNSNKVYNTNNLTRNNNSKNTHKIIKRKREITFSNKSLNLNNHINNTLYDNDSIKKPKKKEKNVEKMVYDIKTYEKNEINSNQKNIKIQNNKESNRNKNNNKYESKKSNKELNKTYSESDLGEVGGEIIDDGSSESENLLKEVNETDDIYYYDPKSIVNYSSVNFINKKNSNKKYQSLSVSKNNNNKVDSKYNNTFNKTVNRSLFSNNNNIDFTQHKKLQTHNFEKINKIEEINHKIKMKNNDIERIIKIINNMKKEINKYNNEIKNMKEMIFDEEQEGYKLRHMINFFSNIK